MKRIREAANASNVARFISQGYLPMLPIEGVVLHKHFDALVAKQAELAKDLNEAMNQTSETWHDNAPADVINTASVTNAISAKKVIDAIQVAVVLDYPDKAEKATLGNTVSVSLNGSDAKTVFLTGTADTTKEYLVEGIRPASLRSPLGAVILGAAEGEKITYDVDKRSHEATILEVGLPDTAFTSPVFTEYDIE